MHTKEKMNEFEKVVEPVIKFLCDNYHPHVSVIVTPVGAELVSGEMYVPCDKHVKD